MNFLKTSKMKIILPSLILMVLLVLSASIVQVHAQNTSTVGSSSRDWLSGGNYPLNWNYNPQNTINTSNVNNLGISWVFPIPAAPIQFSGGGLPTEGVIEPVLVYQGVAYFITNWHRVYALSATDGSTIWYKDLPINF